MLKKISAISCAMLLSACSYITGVGTDNTPTPSSLTSFHREFTPHVVWSQATGVGAEGLYLKLAPAMANHHIFTIDAKGQVCSYDAVSGRAAWCQVTKEHITTGVAVDDCHLFFGTQNAKLYALNQTNGHTAWIVSLPNQMLVAPYVVQNKLIIKTIDGDVCALDKNTGKIVWKYEHTSPVYELRDMSSPQVVDGRVVVGFSDGKLAVYGLGAGELLWERAIAVPEGRGLMNQLVDISADPVLTENRIYVVTYQGKVAALNSITGQLYWEYPLSSYAGMIVTSQKVIVADSDGVLWAFDKITGKLVWKQDKLRYRTLSAPSLQGCYFVVADKEGYVHWLSVATGDFVARTKIPNAEIILAPLVYQDQIYIMTQTGQLSRISRGSI